MSQEFDKFSENYEQVLSEGLNVTGYDSTYFVTAKFKKLLSLNPSLVDAPINFLDYGCGQGKMCEALRRFFPKANYFGVDVSGEMIRYAQGKYEGLGIFAEIRSAEWKQRSYDIIFAAGVFHHIPHEKHEDILNELTGLLASNEKIIIWEHNPLNPFTRKIVRDCPLDEDAVLIPYGHMQCLLKNAQLTRPRIIYTTFFPKFLDFLQPMERFLEWLPLGGQYVAIGENPPSKPR